MFLYTSSRPFLDRFHFLQLIKGIILSNGFLFQFSHGLLAAVLTGSSYNFLTFLNYNITKQLFQFFRFYASWNL